MNSNRRRVTGWIAGGVAVTALCAGGLAIAPGISSALAAPAGAASSSSQRAWYGASSVPAATGSSPWQSGGYGSSSTGSAAGGSTTTATPATATEQKGIVVIDTVLAYDQAEAAGTGIVLSAGGEILTNNHVVEGATSIQVTVPASGRTYTAKVVGTDATDDVAVLQLQGASGLATASLDASGDVTTGDTVTAVGNAGGTGTLVQAGGSVTGTNASITTQAEGSVASENLSGLIETDADIQAGDSGGPMYNSAGSVVGMDTAASSDTSQPDGYAIPIGTALQLAEQIESGQAGGNVSIGSHAFLGVALAAPGSSASDEGAVYGSPVQGAQIAQVYDGTPAASAGLAAGDVITAVNGTSVSSDDDLSAALAQLKPGAQATISWTDATGASQSGTVTLGTAPAA